MAATEGAREQAGAEGFPASLNHSTPDLLDDKEQKASEWRKIGIAFSASWIVVSSILVSALIGLGLDWLFHTRRLFLIVLALLGVVAGMYNLIRELRRMG